MNARLLKSMPASRKALAHKSSFAEGETALRRRKHGGQLDKSGSLKARAIPLVALPAHHTRYQRDHSNKIRNRIETKLLPFFSGLLELKTK